MRTVNEGDQPVSVAPGDGRLVLGHLTDKDSVADREIARGVRAWLRRLDETTRGIPYSDGRIAAVELIDEAVGPGDTEAAARRLVARGATAIIGPADQNQFARLVEVVRGKPILLLSALPRGRSVRHVPQAFYLTRADPFSFATVYDVVGKLPRASTTKRVTILAVPGAYALAGQRAAEVARSRGGRPSLEIVRGDRPRRAALEAKAAAVLVAAPPATAVRWLRGAPRRPRVPWVVGATDLGRVVDAAADTTVAVSVPWSPTSTQGESPALAEAYTALHGGLATTDSAAGATIGLLLMHAVQNAKAASGARLIDAFDQLDVLTLWGQINFKSGEPVTPPAQLVLLDHGAPEPIFPFPSRPAKLMESVPPAPEATATPSPTATPAG